MRPWLEGEPAREKQLLKAVQPARFDHRTCRRVLVRVEVLLQRFLLMFMLDPPVDTFTSVIKNECLTCDCQTGGIT